MNFAWKFMLPMTLINLVAAAVWKFTGDAQWNIVVRWLVSGAIIAGPYVAFGKLFESKASRRVYRYAD
jgi:NADH-quinone oxidoreductase subunit H